MKRFFLNLNSGMNFSFLSFSHIVFTIVTFLIVMLIYLKRKKIVKFNSRRILIYRWLAGVIILITIAIRRGSFLYYGVYNWKYHLDIGFCNITSILFILYCFTGNRKINRLLYYCSFCGPFSAILFPSIDIAMNNYSFFVFILIHNVVFIFTFLFTVYYQLEFSKKAHRNTIFILLIYVFIVYIFNLIYGTNYNSFNGLLNDKLYGISILKKFCSNKLYDILLIVYGLFLMRLSSKLLRKIKVE